jgi:hypothetical protein
MEMRKACCANEGYLYKGTVQGVSSKCQKAAAAPLISQASCTLAGQEP